MAFTVCVEGRVPILRDADLVRAFTGVLGSECAARGCMVPVYYFMPDHVHFMTQGTVPDADAWDAVVRFKQRPGFLLGRLSPRASWQKGFHDHVLRSGEEVAVRARYIADNPVRRRLTAVWTDHPFTGAIGIGLHDVLFSLATRGA